jgi:hypothetical protein
LKPIIEESAGVGPISQIAFTDNPNFWVFECLSVWVSLPTRPNFDQGFTYMFVVW